MAEPDAFEFQDTSATEQLQEVGVSFQHLAKSKGKIPGKDSLVKLLKKARTALETAAQTNSQECQASSIIASSLIEKPFIDHIDQDAKSLVANCLSHVLRLHVSECPYSPHQQKAIFTLFMWVIRQLEDPAATSFTLHQSTLNVIHQTKCCLLLLDLEDEDLLSDMFRVLLGSVNTMNQGEIGGVVLEIMSMLVEDGDDVSPQLLDAILCGLLSDDKVTRSMAQQLIQEQEAILRPSLQRHLLSIVAQEADSDALENGPALILQVQRACPRALLPVMQALSAQLRATSEEVRCATLALVGGLLSVMMEEHCPPSLLTAFVDRSNDVKATVRTAFVQQCSRVLMVCTTEHARQQFVDLLVKGLMDVDESVRLEAVEGVTAAAISRLSLLGEDQHALTEVAGRLRDAKAAVRQAAASRLLTLYRHYISHDNGDDRLAWIPSCLLLQAVLEKSFGAVLLNSATLLRDGLLPPKMSDEDGARHWVAVYQEAPQPARSAIQRLLARRDSMQQDVVRIAQARSQRIAAADDAASEAALAHIERLIRRVAAAVQVGNDASKTEEALLKLVDLKDNHIFKSLVALCAPGASRDTCRKHSKEVQSRTSSRGTVSSVAAAVCRRLTQTLLAPEHIVHLLSLMSQATSHEPPAFVTALADLLVDTAASAPRLFAGQGAALMQLVGSRDEAASLVALRVLADAGSCIAAAAADNGLQFPSEACLSTLLAKVSGQDATAAKTAVRSVAALYGKETAAPHLADTIVKLAGGLALPRTEKAARSVQAAVAAISMAVRLLPQTFGSQAESVAAFVISELMPADMPAKQRMATKQHHRLGLTISCAVDMKLAALKAVARMCTPWCPPNRKLIPDDTSCNGSFGGEAIAEVLRMLLPQLQPLLLLPAVPSEDDTPRPYLLDPEGAEERAGVRWAAGTAVLRIARSHDSATTVPDFHGMALVLSDPEAKVRATFIKQLSLIIRHFQVHRRTSRAAKFASLLFLCGEDPEAHNRDAAMKQLHHFVAATRKSASIAAAAAAARRGGGGTVMQEHPEFMLPYALHLLAHHPDCPSPEEADADEERLQPFVVMLQFGLEPLLLGGGGNQSASAVGGRGLVVTMLRTIRRAVDVSDSSLTDNIRMLSELGKAVADSIVAVATPKPILNTSADRGNDCGHVPGDVPLPHGLYGNAPESAAKPKRLLPSGIEIRVETLFNSNTLLSSPKAGTKPRKQPKQQGSTLPDCANDLAATPTESTPKRKRLSKGSTPSSANATKKQRGGARSEGNGNDDEEAASPALGSPSSSNKKNAKRKSHSRGAPGVAVRNETSTVGNSSAPVPAHKPPKKKETAVRRQKASKTVKKVTSSGSAAAPQERRRQPRRGAKPAAQGKLADADLSQSN